MEILVTVKEVSTVEDEFGIENTTIVDQYLNADLNELDDYAVEEALQLQEAGIADEVVTVTIGPEDCEQTLRQTLAKGADRAVRVWDDALENIDLLDVGAKTAILRAIVEAEEPDLVLTGVQSGDDNWGSTGVSLAAELGLEWGAVVNHLKHDLEDGTASDRRELEGGVEELTEIELPAALTIQTGINEPRYASLRGIRQPQRKELDVHTLGDLGIDEGAVEGAVTVTDMYEPESETDATVWQVRPEETAPELGELLHEKEVAP
ncbi:electron transfer flavoprotein subunit beta/FixA family protein [Natronococcus sp. A-GB1]|uniref:electron transfer flavoprotein subunit beta/FixA family protein n=1 Tax=Natronococcus sp. A-GB1 TaxID=3037648 RepID=UPI00241F8602|nr:electron transfer flavoprotein subunit beta/FixA family protein [Natronococcus sp. A-GB1]MDG5761874.1 electron transfer flavoprotein subunit beta/FixA family protein [Natronococcus sp. A-GB1]